MIKLLKIYQLKARICRGLLGSNLIAWSNMLWFNMFSSTNWSYSPTSWLYRGFNEHQKQPSRAVLTKGCFENIQQIYRRTPMPDGCFWGMITEILPISFNESLSAQNLYYLRSYSHGVALFHCELHCKVWNLKIGLGCSVPPRNMILVERLKNIESYQAFLYIAISQDFFTFE